MQNESHKLIITLLIKESHSWKGTKTSIILLIVYHDHITESIPSTLTLYICYTILHIWCGNWGNIILCTVTNDLHAEETKTFQINERTANLAWVSGHQRKGTKATSKKSKKCSHYTVWLTTDLRRVQQSLLIIKEERHFLKYCRLQLPQNFPKLMRQHVGNFGNVMFDSDIHAWWEQSIGKWTSHKRKDGSTV